MYLLHLHKVWEKWKQLSLLIGSFMGRVWLTLFYFTLVIPFAIIIRFAGNPFKTDKNPKWKPLKQTENSISEAQKQG